MLTQHWERLKPALSGRWRARAAVGSSSGDARAGAGEAAGNILPARLLGQPAPLASAAAINAGAERSSDGQPVVAASAAATAPPPLPAAPAAAAAHVAADESLGEEELEGEQHEFGVTWRSLDDIDAAVHEFFEQEMESLNENVNQAVHTAIEQEMTTLNQAVEQAVETALDRSFDIKANFNTIIALTGVIMYWRGMWNLLDTWLGTDNSLANLGSLLIGLSVMLFFRILRLPLAEFW
ncbi:hypothetical protein ABPG75_001734 [Micractinium tetrahymenae]